MPKWLSIDEQVKELAEESWSTYWAEMMASEAIEFMNDPKKAMLADGLIKADFRIQTQVVNAERGLAVASGPRCVVALVFPEEKLALLTVYIHAH